MRGKVMRESIGSEAIVSQRENAVDVRFQLAQPLDIRNDGVELTLYESGGPLVGQLTIGKAKVKWKKRNARSGSEITTKRLVELIEEEVDSKSQRKRPARGRSTKI
jgi:hypothetical protein